MCTATEGDSLISFLWTKNGSPINAVLGLDIGQSNVYSSTLGITEVNANHSGIYSCIASNSAGIATTSIQLQIDGKSSTARFSVVLQKHHFKERIQNVLFEV